MTGQVTRVVGLLALLCCFAGSKGAKRGGEKENGGGVLEGKLFGEEVGRVKGRVPYWAGLARGREDENDKGKNELTKNRSSSKKTRAPKKIKKDGQKATKAEKEKRKNGRTATKKSGRKTRKKNGRKSAKKDKRKATKKNGRKAPKNAIRATKKNGRKKKDWRKDKKSRNDEKRTIIERECLSTTCIENAVKIMKLLKDRLSFYETKFRRISKKTQIGSSKSGKNLVFQPALARLIAAGGGNASALACGGNSSNAGSGQMANLTEILDQCDVNVKAACDPSGFPLPNMTEVNSCLDNGAVITELSNNCSKLSGSLACSCWEGTDETGAAVQVLKSCDLTPNTKAVTKAMSKCKEVFGKCRKYEDAVADIIHACNQRPATLKKRLKNLSLNKAAVEAVLESITEITSTRFWRADHKRRSITSGQDFISNCQQVVLLIGQNPVSISISTLSTTLANSAANVAFSSEELASLSSVQTSLTNSVDVLTKEMAISSARITTVTGEILDATDIASYEGCATDTECYATVHDSFETPSESITSTTITADGTTQQTSNVSLGNNQTTPTGTPPQVNPQRAR